MVAPTSMPLPDYLTLERTSFSNVARCETIPDKYAELNLALEYEHSRAAAIHQTVKWRTDVFATVSKILTLGQLLPVRAYRNIIAFCLEPFAGLSAAGTQRQPAADTLGVCIRPAHLVASNSSIKFEIRKRCQGGRACARPRRACAHLRRVSHLILVLRGGRRMPVRCGQTLVENGDEVVAFLRRNDPSIRQTRERCDRRSCLLPRIFRRSDYGERRAKPCHGRSFIYRCAHVYCHAS